MFSYMLSLEQLLKIYNQVAKVVTFAALPGFKIQSYNVTESDGISKGVPTLVEGDKNDLTYGVLYSHFLRQLQKKWVRSISIHLFW